MRKFTAKLMLMTVLLALLFSSCKKDVHREVTEPPKTQDWNLTAKTVAKDVSKKLASKAFRKMLKHEVLLRFDGDANILLSSLIRRLPKYLAYEKSTTVSARLNDADLLSNYNFDIIAEAAETFPQMQLAVQTDAESWDANAFIPSVVYITSTYDEATSTTIEGFDPAQNPITVSTTEDPTINYVVVSDNERTVIRESDLLVYTSSNCPVEPVMDDAPYNPNVTPEVLLPAGDCGGTGGGGGSGGGGGGGGTGGGSGHPQYYGVGQDGVLPTLVGSQMGAYVPPPANGAFNRLAPVGLFNGTITYRKDFRHEKMRFIRCDDIGQIEGWPAGAPEIRVHVFEQNVLNPSENLQIFKEEFRVKKRKDIKDKWWDAASVTLHLWDFVGTGTKTSFGYYEYDPVLIPNETLAQIGGIAVDLLFITSTLDSAGLQVIYRNVRNSVQTGIRSLKKKNGMSEYIGKDDYSIFNDEDQFNHSPGGTKFKTWPDL